jgi:hypothetical protein
VPTLASDGRPEIGKLFLHGDEELAWRDGIMFARIGFSVVNCLPDIGPVFRMP